MFTAGSGIWVSEKTEYSSFAGSMSGLLLKGFIRAAYNLRESKGGFF